MIEVAWLARSLAALDEACEAGADALIAGYCVEDRPLTGVAALVDWRAGGWLSELRRDELLLGEFGDRTLLPTRPALPIAPMVLFGLGHRVELDVERAKATIVAMLDTLEGLLAKRAIVELPGRAHGELAANVVVEALLSAVEGRNGVLERVWIVDDAEAQRALVSLTSRPRAR